jgi:protein phosphatase methylesterase 1
MDGHRHRRHVRIRWCGVQTLMDDAAAVVETLLGEEGHAHPPPIVLVGHSMGGALAARLAASKRIGGVVAVVVIDVVEGTAMESLPHMKVHVCVLQPLPLRCSRASSIGPHLVSYRRQHVC